MSAKPPWTEGIVIESTILFHSRGPKTYIVYRSTIDNNVYQAIFDGVSTVSRGDFIRLRPPPDVEVQPFFRTIEYREVRAFLLEEFHLEEFRVDINTVEVSPEFPATVNFFLRTKRVNSLKTPEIENVTRAIIYSH